MTSLIFETINEFSAAIRNIYAQLVLLNRIYIYNANLNATVAPADLFVTCATRVLVFIYINEMRFTRYVLVMLDLLCSIYIYDVLTKKLNM